MNEEVKETFLDYCIVFLCGMLLAGSVFMGINLRESERYRGINGQLAEELGRCSTELDDVRNELGVTTGKLSECLAELERIRTAIGNCQSSVAGSLSEVSAIRNATEKIRKEIGILEEYYNNIDSLYGSLTDSLDNSAEE